MRPALETTTDAVPGVAIAAALTDAASCVELTSAVGSAAPFQSTDAGDRKPLPLRVNVNAAPPAVTE